MNDLKFFNFNGSLIRAFRINNQAWFVAKDIADILEYTDTATMTRRLDDDEKGMQNLQTLGGNQNFVIIDESGLYNAILGSNKPEAKRFKKWVTSEVLPSIRKDGAYIATTPEMSDDEIMARALQAAQRTIDRKNAQLAEAQNQLSLQAPDVEYCNTVLAATNLHTTNSIAVHLGISAIRLNKFLSSEGWIYKQGDIYCPSHKIRSKHYCDFHIVPYLNRAGESCTREHLKWTEEGRRAIIELYMKKAA